MRITQPSFQLLVIITALLGLGIGVAFAGGSYYGRRSAPESETGLPPAAAAPSVATGAPTPDRTTGVVESMDADVVVVRTEPGDSVTVKLQPDTQVLRHVTATRADLRLGQIVTVMGQPGSDGTIVARSVQIGSVAPGGAVRPPGTVPTASPATGP